MNVERDQLAGGTAWITPEGILFQGAFYSCRRALRDRWFARASAGDPTAVQVLYDRNAVKHAAIYIDSEEFMEDCLCQLLPDRGNPDQVVGYQEKIREAQTIVSQIASAFTPVNQPGSA